MDANVRGTTLYRLADHVGLAGHGELLLESLRGLKSTGLCFRSALLGYVPGVEHIAEILELDDPLNPSERSRRQAKCLRDGLTGGVGSDEVTRQRRVAAVAACLTS